MGKFIVLAIVIGLFVIFMMRQHTNKEAAKENIKLGEEFLQSNKTADGVIMTASGLQYKVLTQGEGSIHPSANANVKVHYHGTLLDGSVFDSSVDRGEPISFGLNQVIKGWTEGVQLMVVGEKTRFYIPASLGYGDRPAGKITPGSLLIFDVELLAIN
jgi:peptidylprolyl isomerase